MSAGTLVPLKEGEVLVPVKGTAWATRWKELRLVNSHRFKGVTYWWVEMTSTGGDAHLDTMSIGTLRTTWERKAKFYQIGKTYKFRNVGRTDTWTVLDIYTVDKVAIFDSKHKAVARMDTADGMQDIQTLSQADFDRMVEV